MKNLQKCILSVNILVGAFSFVCNAGDLGKIEQQKHTFESRKTPVGLGPITKPQFPDYDKIGWSLTQRLANWFAQRWQQGPGMSPLFQAINKKQLKTRISRYRYIPGPARTIEQW